MSNESPNDPSENLFSHIRRTIEQTHLPLRNKKETVKSSGTISTNPFNFLYRRTSTHFQLLKLKTSSNYYVVCITITSVHLCLLYKTRLSYVPTSRYDYC